ncbi:hypothetical protein [Piscinibacter sakaiensis]|uniref:Uncharacterized protein n=1 Tax=Piscinibacter sakaiensis TaxID=1547922 RepID=A0A0K8NZN0_PISS1|nr:hypothetical protein [Piscinibacter sakaiensis]GAP35385.1 hypothetical protein ISF6_1156 [Piscinibacter sakaiensis]
MKAPRGQPPAAPLPAPERWQVEAGEAAIARLVVPPDARRERRFEVSVAMTVRATAGPDDAAWHRLTVLADGQRQWQRRVDTHRGAGGDGLDLRFERRVPPGRALQLQAESDGAGVRRLSLRIEAEEVRD